MEQKPPPPEPETKAQTVVAEVVQEQTVVAVDTQDDCLDLTLRAIKSVYDRKGVKGLTQEAIEYYNRCRP